MTFEIVDIGVNLTHASFNKDREAAIARAVKAGVTIMVVTGTGENNSQQALELARKYPKNLYATAGVHPHNVKHCNEKTLSILRELGQQPEIVAIGECGLDFNRDFSPRDVQEKWFEEQIQVAIALKKPLFLHERDAGEKFVKIVAKWRDQIVGAVVHCFTGTERELRQYLDLDLHIGITGWICDERRGQHLKEIVRQVPLNRLTIETDAPFLTPRTIKPRPRDGRNEPAFLPHVLTEVAKSYQISVEELARETTKTAKAFFNIA